MNSLLENISFYKTLDSTIKAIILLVLAIIAGLIVKGITKAIANKIVKSRKDAATASEEVKKKRDSLINILSNIAFTIVFLVFLPGALEKLGLLSVTGPIQSMSQKFLNFLPNLIAAALIIIAGIFIARFVRQLVELGLKKTKLDSLQSKCGIKNEKYSFSATIASFVYAVIMIVFSVAAIRVLHLEAIAGPANTMVKAIFDYIPLIFAASILIIFGVFLSNIVGNLLGGVLQGTTMDEKAVVLFPKKKDGSPSDIKASGIIVTFVKVVLYVIFIVSGIKILNIDILTKVGTAIIAYLPNIVASAIIAIIAWICATKASEAIIKANSSCTGLAITAKAAIFVLAAFMIVHQLGVATFIVNVVFGCAAGAVAVAFAIAFGVGGRDWAGKKLNEMDENIKNQIKKD